MDVTPLVPKGKNIIQSYSNDYVIINGNKYFTPIIISPDQLIIDVKNYQDFKDLKNKPEIFIIGYHSVQQKRHPEDIHAEVMSFGAACRTYNILLTEGREVACFLSAVD